MPEEHKPNHTIQRIGGYLHRIVPIVDSTGKVISHATRPFMVEVRARDVMQMMVGASILAIPVGFTEETWMLGTTLPFRNVLALAFVSLLFIAAFVYFNFYRFHLRGYKWEFIKRIVGIYGVALVVVAVLLTIIDKCPWGIDNLTAMKRVIIVAFPASMSAAVSDLLK